MRVEHSVCRSVGRLCNQLSSYANMLVYQRLFNVQPYLPSEQLRERIQTFFENVTMPVLTDNTSVPACRVTVRGRGRAGLCCADDNGDGGNIFSGSEFQSSTNFPLRTCSVRTVM